MKKGEMRTIVAVFTVAALLISGAVFYSFFVSVTSDNIQKSADAIKTAVEKDDYLLAKSCLDTLFSYLDEKEVLLGATINHNDIYNLRLAMDELSARILEKKKYDSLVCLNILATRIRQLEQNSVLSLFNIL